MWAEQLLHPVAPDTNICLGGYDSVFAAHRPALSSLYTADFLA